MPTFLHFLLTIVLLSSTIDALRNAVRGKKCASNQVVNKLTVYEDGAIEAECGPLPCGSTGICSEDLSSCKAASEAFGGMKWARNGQSLLLRCCALQASNKVYIGTDLVTLGSYYTGGQVPEKDKMNSAVGGIEYDFVANARTEQGGVRVWVYRIVCPAAGAEQQQQRQQQQQQTRKQQQIVPQAQIQSKEPAGGEEQPKFAEIQDSQVESQPQQQIAAAAADPVEEEQSAAQQNPLRYRPRRNQQQQLDPVNRVL